MQLTDFQFLRYLGKGSYGKVYQVRKINEPNLGQVYALKTVKLPHKGIATERNILNRLTHPFLVKLFSTFESGNKFYFVLEYLSGGTLATILGNTNMLSEEFAAFYVQEAIVALEFLHNHGVIYRDLKLSNILLDVDGHIKLIDFGLSEENFTADKLSFVSCGTPYYKSPEIISKIGHGFAVDWWAMGVLLFRMVAGMYPFEGNKDLKVKKAVLSGRYILPESLSPDCGDLISKLLQVDPTDRLGYIDGASAVKLHPFFRNTSWDNVAQRLETPPIVPQITDEEDTSRFPPIDDDVAPSCSANSLQSSYYISSSLVLTVVKTSQVLVFETKSIRVCSHYIILKLHD